MNICQILILSPHSNGCELSSQQAEISFSAFWIVREIKSKHHESIAARQEKTVMILGVNREGGGHRSCLCIPLSCSTPPTLLLRGVAIRAGTGWLHHV